VKSAISAVIGVFIGSILGAALLAFILGGCEQNPATSKPQRAGIFARKVWKVEFEDMDVIYNPQIEKWERFKVSIRWRFEFFDEEHYAFSYSKHSKENLALISHESESGTYIVSLPSRYKAATPQSEYDAGNIYNIEFLPEKSTVYGKAGHTWVASFRIDDDGRTFMYSSKGWVIATVEEATSTGGYQ